MKLPSLPEAWATDFEEVGTDADGNSIHDDVALFTGEQMEAYATEAYAEGRKDERESHAALVTAVEQILDAGHMNTEDLARLRAAWEAL